MEPTARQCPSATLRAAVLATGLLCAFVQRAHASPLFELVGSGYGTGGFNARVDDPGAASTYFNPSLLPRADPGLAFGFFFLSQQVSIRLDPRVSSALCGQGQCDVPEVNGAGPESFRHADGSQLAAPTLPTIWLDEGRQGPDGQQTMPPRRRQAAGSGAINHPYALLGLVAPIFGRYLVLGIHAMLPLDQFTAANSFYPDEREQFFSNSLHPELYADRLAATSIAVGVGSQLLDSLSLGVAFTISLKNTVQAPIYVFNLSDLDTLLLDSNVSVNAAASPHFGLTWEPLARWRLSATVHSPQQLDIDSGFTYLIATGTEQSAGVTFTHDYVPWSFALGTEVEVLHHALHSLSLVGTAKLALWSNYIDRHGEVPGGAFAWSNTVETAIGVRYGYGRTRSFLDMVIAPTPVPEQVGRSNYVDSDRFGWTVGVDYGFDLWGAKLRAGLQGQLHMLRVTQVVKDPSQILDEVPDDAEGGLPRGPIPGREGLQTNNPGFPGYQSYGWLMGIGANVELAF